MSSEEGSYDSYYSGSKESERQRRRSASDTYYYYSRTSSLPSPDNISMVQPAAPLEITTSYTYSSARSDSCNSVTVRPLRTSSEQELAKVDCSPREGCPNKLHEPSSQSDVNGITHTHSSERSDMSSPAQQQDQQQEPSLVVEEGRATFDGQPCYKICEAVLSSSVDVKVPVTYEVTSKHKLSCPQMTPSYSEKHYSTELPIFKEFAVDERILDQNEPGMLTELGKKCGTLSESSLKGIHELRYQFESLPEYNSPSISMLRNYVEIPDFDVETVNVFATEHRYSMSVDVAVGH